MWLHVPASCLSAPATEGLTSQPEPCGDTLARSVTWRGKLRASPFWRRAWRTAPWMRLLSGVTSSPSTLEHGVAAWISSWQVSRASRSRSLASSAGTRTSAGSGPRSPTSSASAGHQLSFSRMSLASYRRGLGMSSQTLTGSGSMRSGRVSAHPTSARRTGETGSSYWPTATAQSYGTNQGGRRGVGLNTEAAQWATPSARDHRSICASPATHDRNSRPLSEQVGLQVQKTEKAGSGGMALNPQFVETLMGLPVGWTSVAPTGCACSATASCGCRRPPPSLSLSDASRDDAPATTDQTSRAGEPTTVHRSDTSRITTEPAPTIDQHPIRHEGRTTVPVPSVAPSPIETPPETWTPG